MRESKDVPMMDATLLVSQWTGEWGLKNALRQRETEAGRTLTSNAVAVCELCGGTGMKSIMRDGYPGVTKCDHGNAV